MSKPADVFAFAMLAVEVFTGEVSWEKTTKVAAVISKIPRGDRPNRLKNINDVVWGLLMACWDQDPQKRPNIGNIVEKLKIPDESRNEDPLKCPNGNVAVNLGAPNGSGDRPGKSI